MHIKLKVSPLWRSLNIVGDIGDVEEVEYFENVDTIRALIEKIKIRLPVFSKHIFDEQGGIRRIANFYINGDDIRFLSNQETPLKDGDIVEIIAAIIATDSLISAITVAEQLRNEGQRKKQN